MTQMWGKTAAGAGVLLFIALAAVGGIAGANAVTRPAALVVGVLVLFVFLPVWGWQAARARKASSRHAVVRR